MLNDSNITHYYQPTNNSCSQSSLAMLLSYHGESITPEEIMNIVPVRKRDDGTDWGTINQDLANWCINKGYKVTLYTADLGIIDMSWKDLETEQQVERMELAKETRNYPSLGKEPSSIYVQTYIDFLKLGGKLIIEPFFTTRIIDEAIAQSPVLACVFAPTLYKKGRQTDIGLRTSKPDDINGNMVNHSIVIVKKLPNDNYLIADPWQEPGYAEIEPEHLLAAMASSIYECDNLFFQLKKN